MTRDYLLKQLPIQAILSQVAEKHGITLSDLTSKSRLQRLVLPRHEACWRCSTEAKASLPKIGRALNRDHTSVLHGIRKHIERMAAVNG